MLQRLSCFGVKLLNRTRTKQEPGVMEQISGRRTLWQPDLGARPSRSTTHSSAGKRACSGGDAEGNAADVYGVGPRAGAAWRHAEGDRTAVGERRPDQCDETCGEGARTTVASQVSERT